MKINLQNAQINKVTTLADNSTRLTIDMLEMSPENMTKLFMCKQGGTSPELEFELDETESKSPSQRLRSVLYVLFEQSPKHKETYKQFENFYRSQIEAIINKIKDRLT